MNTTEIYQQIFDGYMQYNLDALIEIAAVDYNIFIDTDSLAGPITKEELAGVLATREIENMVK